MRGADFTGANLSVLHTPAEWGPPEVFSMVQSVRTLNRQAGLDQFLVLVGCGLSNVHMFREALYRQTKHVQFVVFERADQNATGSDPKKLRETNSFFLLAYFFPGSDKEGSAPPERMVREGLTTNFRTESVEALENAVVHALSETGDWVLDLCCRSRELSLAAQKSGRNAIAVDESVKCLGLLQERAGVVAAFHDKAFRQDVDGLIAKL